MKRHSLCTVLSVRFLLLVLAVVLGISVVSNLLISRQFEAYVGEQQKTRADELAQNLSDQYDAARGGWNIDYVHGLGMAVLEDGFILRLRDREGKVLWDAENHDMMLCHRVMENIARDMREKRPELEGRFLTHHYDLKHAGIPAGSLDISYYSPYYIDRNDFRFMSALNRILIAVGGVSLAAAMIMGWLLAARIVRPLSETVESTRRIAGGDYTARLRSDIAEKEVYELTRAINRMADSLREQEELRKRLTSDVAHELRTPVAGLSSCVEMMIDGVLEPTPERLRGCQEELRRLSGLISDLERLREAEGGELTLRKRRVELRALAETVLRSFESQLAEKGLTGRVSGGPAEVFADPGRLRQVVTNLISNAVKYSREGGNIRVVIAETEKSCVLRVEDDGIGIPREDLSRIFERFYRTDVSRNRKTGGAGIGLAIVRSIVRAHGGSVTAESGEGGGSVFSVTLPRGEQVPSGKD